ncbi:P protein-like [Phymastichus coffea]|uniref:P protein-like n=1 Tax=Phymastichus coffea TaxID=108790 RepID=UPI00273AC89C|nr:P protein-like [Phymastichus coffea]
MFKLSSSSSSNSSCSEEDEISRTTQCSIRESRMLSSISQMSSSVRIGNISEDFLKVWSKLPEAIRLDPSLAFMQKEYNKMQRNFSGTNTTKTECLVLNLSLKPQQMLEDIQNNNEYPVDKLNLHQRRLDPIARYTKLSLLVICWMICLFALIVTKEKIEVAHQIVIGYNETKNVTLANDIRNNKIDVTLEGSLLITANVSMNANQSLFSNHISLWIESFDFDYFSCGRLRNRTQHVSRVWNIPLLPVYLMNMVPNQKIKNIFHLNLTERSNHHPLLLKLKTNMNTTVLFTLIYNESPINIEDGVLYAAAVLVGLYVLIIFELVHKTIAAMLASTSSIAILAMLNEKPTMKEIISWIDADTLLLLFSMMVLVTIFSDTGMFDYLAVYAYKITNGKIWSLVCLLCFFTAFISAFLDNVTTALLMTPVTIRLCELMQLNPVPVLTAMVIFSNIGGSITPIGDPPNVIIVSNRIVFEAGINFGIFTSHMSIGIILILFTTYVHFCIIFRNLDVLRFDEPQDIQELRHEIIIWQRAAASLSSYSRDENIVRATLMKKIKRLLYELKQKLVTGSVLLENYQTTLEELENKYPIRNKWLLLKSGISMILVITLFFLHNSPYINLSLGWMAFFGVLLLFILADNEDFDGIMARVEWSTLLFFAALFVLIEALSKLGLIAFIGKKTELVVMSVNEDYRLAVAILLLLWVSAIAGSFVDNVPLATMMVRIATKLAENQELQLPLQPLIWALAFGSCLGGNGTLIGATANVVCAGIAEQHGYHFTFMKFFKIGFPVLITSTLTATVYLMIAHVAFKWNH